jgi:hypothetical protein
MFDESELIERRSYETESIVVDSCNGKRVVLDIDVG